MIKKFIKISGTGRFLNYNHKTAPLGHQTEEFKKINLIYGENGSGKTTLSVILQSLRDNDAILVKKRSFDRSFPQDVTILTDAASNRQHHFTNGTWNNHYPDIEIFDIHFINDNIYTGMEILPSHRKNLLEIVFGQTGIRLKTEIQEIKDDIQEFNRKVKEITTRIEAAIESSIPVAQYVTTAVDLQIDAKIAAKESEILTAKSAQEIASKSSLTLIPPIQVDFNGSAVTALMNQSIDSISEEYLRKFNEHKGHLRIEGNTEEWLKKGFHAIEENLCPFCQQGMPESLEILKSYRQYFNEAYSILLESLAEVAAYLENFNLEASIQLVENRIIADNSLIDFWSLHVSVPPALSSVDVLKSSLITAFSSVRSALELKSRNPIRSLDASSVIGFREKIDEINTVIQGFNAQITAYNARIATLKITPRADIRVLEADLKRLKAIKKRGETAMSNDCTTLQTNIQIVATLNGTKTAKQQQLETYSIQLFSNYATKINQYLRIFAPYLDIRNLDSGYVGSAKEPQIKYALHIEGHEIKMEDNPTSPSFKYSLSEGDKSALALAFFMARLETDTSIQNKIIVFDDPVSSFDLNRKTTTINNLLSFGGRARQLFVLTHNIVFAGEFWKASGQFSMDRRCSKIVFLGNTSNIVEYHIESETLSSILKDSLVLKNFISDGCVKDEQKRGVARCIRPALESYFHLKFFDLLGDSDWLGRFIEKVRDSVSGDSLNRLASQLPELNDLNDYSKKFHHRFNGLADSEPVNDTELRNYCQRTLNLIQLI